MTPRAWARVVAIGTAGSGDRWIHDVLVGTSDDMHGREVQVLRGGMVVLRVSLGEAEALWAALGELLRDMAVEAAVAGGGGGGDSEPTQGGSL